MRFTENCNLGETVEHSISSVLEASVSGVGLPRTTHVCCPHVSGQLVFFPHPFPAVAKPNHKICCAAALYLQ